MTMVVQPDRSKEESDHEIINSRLEKARDNLMADSILYGEAHCRIKEADAVAAAIEDELIALRVSLLRGR